jgi:hypothetical protein
MHRIYFVFVLLVGLFFWATGCVSQPPTQKLQTVSFSDVKLEKYEYIQSVEVSITRGHVASVNRLLDDWETDVHWDNPGLKIVDLQAGHFSSGLASIHKLDGFISIIPDDSYFDIKATLITKSCDPTGRTPRRIFLNRSQLILTPQPPK